MAALSSVKKPDKRLRQHRPTTSAHKSPKQRAREQGLRKYNRLRGVLPGTTTRTKAKLTADVKALIHGHGGNIIDRLFELAFQDKYGSDANLKALNMLLLYGYGRPNFTITLPGQQPDAPRPYAVEIPKPLSLIEWAATMEENKTIDVTPPPTSTAPGATA